MKPEVTAALIGAGATILAALIGLVGVFGVGKATSSRTRRQSGIPQIMGTKWDAVFKFEDGSLYTSELIAFEEWTGVSQFQGHGEVTHNGKHYKYPITGEVSPGRVVILNYKAENFPTEANIGTACLQLTASAEVLEGTWAGLVSTKQQGKEVSELRGGNVTMKINK